MIQIPDPADKTSTCREFDWPQFPSPQPSPDGRGSVVRSAGKGLVALVFQSAAGGIPSPWGEGQGEGKRNAGLHERRRLVLTGSGCRSLLRALFAVLLLTGVAVARAQEKVKSQDDSSRRARNLPAVQKRTDRGASALGGYLTRGDPQELRFGTVWKKTPGFPALPPRTDPTAVPQKPDSEEHTQSNADKPKREADEAGKGRRDDTSDDAKKKPDSGTEAGSGTKREITAKDLIPFFQKGRPPQHGASGLVPFRGAVSDENLSSLMAPRSGAKK